jgi:hypothetical protein
MIILYLVLTVAVSPCYTGVYCRYGVREMDGGNSKTKSVLLATRVTPRIKDVVERMAIREGLSVSEWLRNLVVIELKKEEALPSLKFSDYEYDK